MSDKKTNLPEIFEAPYAVGVVRELQELIAAQLKKLDYETVPFKVEPPSAAGLGDYTTNVALLLHASLPIAKKTAISPPELARKIAESLSQEAAPMIQKVDVAGPGFINISVKNSVFIIQLYRLLSEKNRYGQSEFLVGKRILLEHTSPDPIKTIHIGHLRNNFLGMAFYRIFQAHGAQVCLDCVNNDRGTHVCRAMLGYLAFGRKQLDWSRQQLLEFSVSDQDVLQVAEKIQWEELLDHWLTRPADWWQPEDLNLKSDQLNLIFYSLGDRAERLVESVGPQVRQLLQAWEAEKGKVRALWRQIIDWSLSGYQQTYARIGSRFDQVWFESELYQEGKEMIRQGLENGVFQKGKEGAVVTNLETYGLPDTVAIKTDGTALYLTFDLNLTGKKREYFPADVYIWDIGNDQVLYLQQLFAVCEQLGVGRREDYFHLNYGYVSLAGGEKMSSRKGTVIVADELLDQLRDRAQKLMVEAHETKSGEGTDQVSLADQIGLAALKYALLRTGRTLDIRFDAEASVSLSGDCGPYLQYTHARTQSVLQKALEMKVIFSLSPFDLFRGELAAFVGGSRSSPWGSGLPPFTADSSFGDGLPPSQPSGPFGPPLKGPHPFPAPAQGEVFRPSTAHQPVASEPDLNAEESAVLRLLARYPEVLLEAAKQIETAPLCGYLYDLASAYNQLYNQHQILEIKKDQSAAGQAGNPETDTDRPNLKERLLPPANQPKADFLRLSLTAGVAQVLANGLGILGIDAPEKM